jgi:hypothetical protein
MLWWLAILSAIAVLGLTEEWFMLWWLVILSAIAVLGLTEEWFMLWWLAILSAIAVLGLTEEWFMLWWLATLSTKQYHLRLNREVVHIEQLWLVIMSRLIDNFPFNF